MNSRKYKGLAIKTDRIKRIENKQVNDVNQYIKIKFTEGNIEMSFLFVSAYNEKQ